MDLLARCITASHIHTTPAKLQIDLLYLAL